MQNTENLRLPYLIAAQAQKHVTHNEALRMLDVLVQLSVKTDALATPPSAPEAGARYIIAEAANEAWAGRDRAIAAFQDGAWTILEPHDGWRAWIEDREALAVFIDGAWQTVDSGSQTDRLGINASADDINRLSVASDATLFNHDGEDHRVKVNRATENDTASLLFQTEFEGRAEIGLTGSDDLSVKVSPNGQNWANALVVNAGSGEVHLPNTPAPRRSFFNLLQDAGRFGGSPEAQGRSVGAFVAPGYLTSYNGSNFSAHDRFHYNSSTFGGTGTALHPDVESLVRSLTPTPYYQRYRVEFWVLKLTCGAGTAFANTIDGVSRYMSISNMGAPLGEMITWGAHFKVLSGSIAVRNTGTEFDLFRNGQAQSDHVVLDSSDGWNQLIYTTIEGRETIGFDTTLFKLFAEPESEYLIALPFIFPGRHVPMTGEIIGCVPSMTGWR